MRTIAQLCTRAIFLDHGKLLYDGDTSHAVALYSGTGERTAVRDLDSLSRLGYRGFKMRMLKLEFIGTDTLEYQMDDVMEFVLTTSTQETVPQLRLRLILETPGHTPLAVTHSPPMDVQAGETFTMRLRFPLRGVAPGEYAVKFSLVDGKPGGKSVYYDTVEDAGRFIIMDDLRQTDGFNWQERLWGNFRLPPMEWADE